MCELSEQVYKCWKAGLLERLAVVKSHQTLILILMCWGAIESPRPERLDVVYI